MEAKVEMSVLQYEKVKEKIDLLEKTKGDLETEILALKEKMNNDEKIIKIVTKNKTHDFLLFKIFGKKDYSDLEKIGIIKDQVEDYDITALTQKFETLLETNENVVYKNLEDVTSQLRREEEAKVINEITELKRRVRENQEAQSELISDYESKLRKVEQAKAATVEASIATSLDKEVRLKKGNATTINNLKEKHEKNLKQIKDFHKKELENKAKEAALDKQNYLDYLEENSNTINLLNANLDAIRNSVEYDDAMKNKDSLIVSQQDTIEALEKEIEQHSNKKFLGLF